MAELDDLDYEAITSMTPEEAIEYVRKIRLSRRVPIKDVSKRTTRRKAAVPTVSSDVAAEILKLLTGE